MNEPSPVVQLDRVRLAIATLDRLIAEHPELQSDTARERLTDKFDEMRTDEDRALAAFQVLRRR